MFVLLRCFIPLFTSQCLAILISPGELSTLCTTKPELSIDAEGEGQGEEASV